ncbi:DUF4834 family protein [Thermophagus sp. OGC60D27]|uniref:DUF4834 family protein n=1 Tax=Thermophagus sp. OGC60D27 TaxID=3458415 RepID=UPI0040384152
MLFRVIIYTILIYYLIKLIVRYLFPFFISRQVRNMQNRQERAQKDFVNQRKKEEGKVTIEYTPGSSKTSQNKGPKGEYVDYEEIE